MQQLHKVFQDVQTEVGNVSAKIQDVGKSMSSVGAGMTAGITAPIAAIAAAGAGVVMWGSNILQSQGQIQVSLGVTAEEADRLTESAMNVWKNGFGENIEAVNQTIISVRQNMGDLAGQELESVAAGALTISQIFGEDVNAITATAGVLMRNFGIDGQHALDIITAGYQQGGDFSKELLDTLREYAPQFKAMGVSADEFLAILISGAQAGAWNLDKVADAVKEFNIRAQDGSTTTMEGFAAIGLNADEMGQKIAAGGDSAKEAFMATVAGLMAIEDPVKRNIAGVALFGTQWEDVKAQVIDATASGIQNVQDVAGATDQAAKDVAASNPMQELINMSRELQAEFLPVVEDQIIPLLRDDLVPILRDTLIPVLKDYIIPAIAAAAQAFGDLPQPVQVVILAVMALLVALGPIIYVVGSVVSAVGTLAAAFGTGGALAGAMAFVTGTLLPAVVTAIGLLTTPIGLIVVAIAALALAWKNNWFDIQGKTAAAIEAIKAAIDRFKTNLSTIWALIVDIFRVNGQLIASLLTGIVNTISNFKSQAIAKWEEIKAGISAKLNEIIASIQTWIANQQARYTTAVANLNTFKTNATARWNEIKSQILAKLNEIISDFQNWTNNQVSKLNDVISKYNNYKSQATARWNEIKAAIKDKLDAMVNDIKSHATSVGNAVQSIVDKITGKIQSFKNAGAAIIQAIKDGVESKIQSVKDSINGLLSWIDRNMPHSPADEGPLSRLPDFSAYVTQPLAKAVASAKSTAKGAGSSIIDSIASSFKSAAKTVYNAASSALSSVKKLLPNSPAEEGPFSEIPDWDSIFLNPILKSISEVSKLSTPLSNALSNVRSPLDAGLSGGLKGVSNISNVSNSYGGDTLVLENVSISNNMDVQAIFKQFEAWTAQKRRARGIA